MPLTSIIIATHCRPHLLGRAVESARAAGDDIEVIVVDDASMDQTESVARALPDIKYVRLERNQGVAGARNMGLLVSSGEFVTFLDDDDLRIPGTLNEQVKFLRANPAAGLVYGQAIVRDISSERVYPLDCPQGDVFWQLLTQNFIPCGSALFRRSCVDRIGVLDSYLAGIDDWDLWIRIAELHPVIALAKPGKFRPLFLVGMTIASALSVSMGLYFRPHYFVMLLPALSLFAGVAAAYAAGTQHVITRVIALLVFAISVAFPIATRAEYFFWMSPVDACRFRYGENPFPEAIKVADFLRENSGPDERLVVLGSEPEIYFYSGRQSATGFIYMYPLMEQQRFASKMQRQMIEEVEKNRPGFVVWVWTPMSWRVAASSERLLFQWADQYLNDNYRPVGLVNMPPQGRTDYYLPIETADLQLAENFIIIFQRR